jgi:hypothetical protein
VAQRGLSFGEAGLHEDAVVDEEAANDVAGAAGC